MNRIASSSDFDLLSHAASYIRSEFDQDDIAWHNSPFSWVRRLSSGAKGKLGKKLIYQWCALKGLSVDRCLDSEADMLINQHRVEIKFSTLWRNGTYRFQQIRDQRYEYCIFLGISPNEAHCWVIRKEILQEFAIGHLGQHTGSKGKETAWVKVIPSSPPMWMANCGGNLDQAFTVLKSLSQRK